jgi:hypothetical protein
MPDEICDGIKNFRSSLDETVVQAFVQLMTGDTPNALPAMATAVVLFLAEFRQGNGSLAANGGVEFRSLVEEIMRAASPLLDDKSERRRNDDTNEDSDDADDDDAEEHEANDEGKAAKPFSLTALSITLAQMSAAWAIVDAPRTDSPAPMKECTAEERAINWRLGHRINHIVADARASSPIWSRLRHFAELMKSHAESRATWSAALAAFASAAVAFGAASIGDRRWAEFFNTNRKGVQPPEPVWSAPLPFLPVLWVAAACGWICPFWSGMRLSAPAYTSGSLAGALVYPAVWGGWYLVFWAIQRTVGRDDGALPFWVRIEPWWAGAVAGVGFVVADLWVPQYGGTVWTDLAAPAAMVAASNLALLVCNGFLYMRNAQKPVRLRKCRDVIKAGVPVFDVLGVQRDDVVRLAWALFPGGPSQYRTTMLTGAIALDAVGSTYHLVTSVGMAAPAAGLESVTGYSGGGLLLVAACSVAALTLDGFAWLRQRWAIEAKATLAVLGIAYAMVAAPFLPTSAFGWNWLTAVFIAANAFTIAATAQALAPKSFASFSLLFRHLLD